MPWIQPDITFTDDVRCWANIGNTLFVGCRSSHLYYSSDYGNSWTLIDLSGVFGSAPFTSLIAVSGVLYATFDGYFVSQSTDNGFTWTRIDNSQLPGFGRAIAFFQGYLYLDLGLTNGIYRRLLSSVTWGYMPFNTYNDSFTPLGSPFFAQDAFTLYLRGLGVVAGALFKTNNGIDWTQSLGHSTIGHYGAGLSISSNDNYAIAMRQNTNDSPNNLYISNDHGISWSIIENGLPTEYNLGLSEYEIGYVDASVILPNNDFYIANAGDIYKSTDQTNWIAEGAGISPQNFYNFADSIFAGTSSGIYRNVLAPEAPVLIHPANGAINVYG